MTNWNRTQGDQHDTLTVRLGGLDDNGLIAATAVEGHVWRSSSSDPATVLTAAVSDAVAGEVTVDLQGWLNGTTVMAQTSTAEVWLLEVQVSSAGTGSVLTWPEGRKSTITVWRQGG